MVSTWTSKVSDFLYEFLDLEQHLLKEVFVLKLFCETTKLSGNALCNNFSQKKESRAILAFCSN